MITITTAQRKIKISTKKMTQDVKTILRHLNYQNYDVNILLTTNRTIRKYNKQYRHKDKATDILSFPFYPNLKPGQRIQATSKEDPTSYYVKTSEDRPPQLKASLSLWEADELQMANKCLGDIIISLEYVRTTLLRQGLLLRPMGYEVQVEGQASKKLETTFDQRMQRLLAHGICHLIGYDHETDEEYEVMLKKENELLELITPAQ